MTKLEQEIWNAQIKVAYSSNPTDHARAAAEVAKKYIEKALDYNVLLKTFDATPQEIKSKWLKENGITE